jgi:membrane dipeptidase
VTPTGLMTGGGSQGGPLLPMADAHNDLLLDVIHQRERGHADPFGDFWLPQLRAVGVVLQVLPVYTEEQFTNEGALRRALLVLETARWIADRHAADVAICETGPAIRAAIGDGRIALVLAFEGLEPVGSSLEVLDAFFRLGVRIASLTWNRRTMFADGIGERATGGGLTSLGVEAIAEMERLGMVVDVSHLADAGFDHLLRIATRPFIASHSSCRALSAHPRNLDDRRIRALADRGGFLALNAFGGFLADQDATIADFVDHIAHAVEVAGADHVGLGLDFVADVFTHVHPILGAALFDIGDVPLARGIQRPADLAALGPLLVDRLGAHGARKVASETEIEVLSRLLPSD